MHRSPVAVCRKITLSNVAQQADWHVTKLWSRFPNLSSGEAAALIGTHDVISITA